MKVFTFDLKATLDPTYSESTSV